MVASRHQVHRTGQARGSLARAPAPYGLVPWERVMVASHRQLHRTGQARGSPARAAINLLDSESQATTLTFNSTDESTTRLRQVLQK
jgi:hypothetical protein